MGDRQQGQWQSSKIGKSTGDLLPPLILSPILMVHTSFQVHTQFPRALIEGARKRDKLRRKAKEESSTIAKALIWLKTFTDGHSVKMVMTLTLRPGWYIMHSRHAPCTWQASGGGCALRALCVHFTVHLGIQRLCYCISDGPMTCLCTPK